jgi:hypothetical protein
MEKVKEINRFGQLLESLADGWEIEEPVLLGARWRSGAYHFVLRKKTEDKTTLLSLPPSPELLVFLSEHKINIRTI